MIINRRHSCHTEVASCFKCSRGIFFSFRSSIPRTTNNSTNSNLAQLLNLSRETLFRASIVSALASSIDANRFSCFFCCFVSVLRVAAGVSICFPSDKSANLTRRTTTDSVLGVNSNDPFEPRFWLLLALDDFRSL